MSYQNICKESDFLRAVSEHEMIVVRDDGIHRHIRFKQPGTYNLHFDLITWPGYLCYTGDMGTYVFSRLDDMFEFFRTDRDHMRLRDGKTLAINPRYWGEKLQAVERSGDSGRYLEFSEEKFNRAVIDHLVGWIRNNAIKTTKEERRDLWDTVVSDVIYADGDSGGYRKQCAAHDFYHRVNGRIEFYFKDFFERDVLDYTHGFMWCCYAIAWGVKKYDESKIEPALATANFPCGSMGEEISP